MTDDVKPRDIIKASHINRITPDDGEVIVGGETGPVRRPLSDFDNSAVLAQVDMDLSGKADISTVDALATQVGEFPAQVAAVETAVARVAPDVTGTPGDSIYIGPSGPVFVHSRVNAAAYSSLAAAFVEGAGKTITVPPGSYPITAALPVASGTAIDLHANVEIEQITKYTAVFDCLNADRVTIDGNGGARLMYLGDRTYGAGIGSARGDSAKALGSGIWSNGSHSHFGGLEIEGFLYDIYLSAWNGTVLADYAKEGNVVEDVTLLGANSGLLIGGQVNGVFRNVRGNYLTYAGKPDPQHLLYVTKTGKHRNLTFDTFIAWDGLPDGSVAGHAFQVRGVDGGSAKNMQARNCTGLVVLDSCNDFDFEGKATSDRGHAIGSVSYFDANTVRCSVDAEIVQGVDHASGQRLAYVIGTDNRLTLNARTRQPVSTGGASIEVRGTRNAVDVDVRNTQDDGSDYTTGLNGVRIFSGSDHQVRVRRMRATDRAVVVDAAASRTSVEIVDAAQVTSFNVDQALIISSPTTTLRRTGTYSTTVAGAGQTARGDATIHDHCTVAVTSTDAFTVRSPYGSVPVGTRYMVTIQNTSGGAMGAITWTSLSLNGAWANPATGASRSVEFVWDGVAWKEIGRTA